MSGNDSRKHKAYIIRKKNKILFGDILAKDNCGINDLVALSAARGKIVISKSNYGSGINLEKTKAL